MLILIGSRALAHFIPEVAEDIISGKRGKDLDIIGSYDEVIEYMKSIPNWKSCVPVSGKKQVLKHATGIVEAEIAWEGSTTEKLVQSIVDDPDTLNVGEFLVPSFAVLYAFKMSHRFLRNSPHFLKTMDDILLMRRWIQALWKGTSYEQSQLFMKREKETYDYGHPSLNQSKSEFFSGDGVQYVYDHDSIHEAVKHNERPAYEFFKPDTNDVLCCPVMFGSLPLRIRLSAVIEESSVLAIERSLVPFPGVLSPFEAYKKSLMKVCTSITSGWFRQFAWENYYAALEGYDPYYFDKFKVALERGQIKEHKADVGR